VPGMTHPLLPLAEEFETLPDLRCPTCGFGHLTREKRWVRREDAATADAKARRWEDFDPDWTSGVSGGFLECAHKGCGEQVVVAGSWRVAYSPRQDGEWADMLRLTYARPALRLVERPAGTPEPVVAAVALAGRDCLVRPRWGRPTGCESRSRSC
jgi:hypothetical protein